MLNLIHNVNHDDKALVVKDMRNFYYETVFQKVRRNCRTTASSKTVA